MMQICKILDSVRLIIKAVSANESATASRGNVPPLLNVFNNKYRSITSKILESGAVLSLRLDLN